MACWSGNGEAIWRDIKKADLFKEAKVLVPVPLHRKRKRKRGYNQAEVIANGLSVAMHIPVDAGTLVRGKANETQTRKTHYERWKNVDSIFEITNMNAFKNKHIIVVDDVITTGSTMEACVQSLLQVEGIKVSVVTLACA